MSAGATRLRLRLPTSERAALLVIVGGQALWLGVLCDRGWFYRDDLNYMGEAAHRSLGWNYLTDPVGAHLTPGLRLVFWVLTHGPGLNYGVTIAGRLVLQAISTVLLYRLLSLVSRSQLVSLVVTAGYAFSPLLVPATLYLASSANQEPAQIGLLLALYGCARQASDGRLRWAVLAGVGLFVAACFWEKGAADTAVVLVMFRVGWLTTGSIRQRATETVRQWRAWLLMLGPLVGFAIYFLTHGYGHNAGSGWLTGARAGHLIWAQWSRSLWPAVLGGPWRWSSSPSFLAAFAEPTTTAIVLGQVAFVAAVVVARRRAGWSGALAWTMPLAAVVVGQILVGIGRYTYFGQFVPIDYHYIFDLAVPMALAAVLAFSPGGLVATPSRRDSARPAARVSSVGGRRVRTVAVAGFGGAVIISSLVSSARWTAPWHKNPSREYVEAMVASVRAAGPGVTLYDTPDPSRVEPFLTTDRYLSNLIGAAGVPARFDQSPPAPALVTDSGQLVAAVFVPESNGVFPQAGSSCLRLRGATPITVRLSPQVGSSEYYLRITYEARLPTAVRLTVRTAHGTVIPARDSPTLSLAAGSGETITALRYGAPTQVTLTGRDAGSNVCVRSVAVGFPHAVSP